jgi:hypothetical protein
MPSQGGDGDDTAEGDCPHSCVSQLFCVQAEGIGLGEYTCTEEGTICCDLSGPDVDTDSDTATDTDDDTGLEPCPFECMSIYACNSIEGEVYDDYGCENEDHVCCEEVVDTDTGYKGSYWKCLICEQDPARDPAAGQGSSVLGFIWNLLTGK